MIYHHPLAYLLGLEGVALLRAWAGDHGREFTEARLAEVRRLLADPGLAKFEGVTVARRDLETAYRDWAPGYDEGRNSLFDSDEPVLHEIIDALPPGDALDAACGTGRLAEHLAARGHRVTGVDGSADMLARAHARVTGATFLHGDLAGLPVPDRSQDAVTCALALVHVPDLAPVMAEFARVLRPGGHLVISDVHHELVTLGSVVPAKGPGGEPGRAPTHRHTPGDYLRAALPAGLEVRRCEEPRPRFPATPAPPAPEVIDVGEWAGWPWTLIDLVPAAARAAFDQPSTIVWHFQAPPG